MKLKPFYRNWSRKNSGIIVRIKRTEITGSKVMWRNKATIKVGARARARARVRARAIVREPGIYLNRRRDQVTRTAFRALIAYVE